MNKILKLIHFDSNIDNVIQLVNLRSDHVIFVHFLCLSYASVSI